MTVNEILFSLIRHEICGTDPSLEVVNAIDDEALAKLYKLSKKYNIAQIAASSLSKLGKLSGTEASKLFRKEMALSVLRFERMNYDYERICEIFEDGKIPYIPLKGSVIRKYYPEDWMRTSCDIDILVKEEDIDRAVEKLLENGDFTTKGNRDFHDISVYSENGTHLELHFNIMENMENIDGMLMKVWEYAKPAGENSFRYEMTNEYMIFHNVAHMSYHFINGGCGIRPFIDLYLLQAKTQYDEGVLSEICASCGIDIFRREMEKLTKIWLENAAGDEISGRIERHIFSGGLYGNLETGTAVKQAKHGGKFKYIMTRVFQPYNVIKEKYPILKKHKWLLPVYQVKRWGVILTQKNDGIGKHLRAGNNTLQKEIDEMLKLFEDVGIG